MGRQSEIRCGLCILAGSWVALGAAGIAAASRAGWSAFAISCLVAMFLAGLAGFALTGSSLLRARALLIRATEGWTGGSTARRMDSASAGFLRPLAEAMNRLAETNSRKDEVVRLGVEHKMLQTEKLATVGQLAAGVAHEINNPLAAILLYGNLLVETTEEADPRRANMQRIVAQAKRAQEIVKGLLDFARQTPHRIARLDVNVLLTETLDLLERHPGMQAAQLRVEASATPLWVNADRGKIQQVLINVVVNALESMHDGGDLTIRTGFSERPGTCRIAVTDTGCGIPDEHLPFIFDPFFSTKEVGQGTGLGLAISYGIIQQHGGQIEVQSVDGAGTTVRILLPCESEAP